MTPVQELEARFLPLLEAGREQSAQLFPDHSFKVWSSSVGGATIYQGHDVGLEALLSDAHPDQANTVALSIGVMHLTTEPMIADAGVAWGAGDSPDVAADLIPEPIPFTSEALASIEREFPKLLEVFQQAVAAWATRPPNSAMQPRGADAPAADR